VYGAFNQLYGTGSELVQMIVVSLLKKLPVVVEHLGICRLHTSLPSYLLLRLLVEFKSAHPVSLRYRGADNSLVRPRRKQATATEDFEFHLSYLYL